MPTMIIASVQSVEAMMFAQQQQKQQENKKKDNKQKENNFKEILDKEMNRQYNKYIIKNKRGKEL